MEMIKIKSEALYEDFDDETAYFLDVFEDFVDKDFNIPKSMKIARDKSQNFVSPHYFENLMKIL